GKTRRWGRAPFSPPTPAPLIPCLPLVRTGAPPSGYAYFSCCHASLAAYRPKISAGFPGKVCGVPGPATESAEVWDARAHARVC
ncbi:MAG: hypothetical protein ACPIOQ_60295, partial [Promethearchaeia archaeon]